MEGRRNGTNNAKKTVDEKIIVENNARRVRDTQPQ